MLRPLLLTVLLLASVKSVQGQCPPPQSSDDDSWLVFGSFRGGSFASSVHRVAEDGSGECQISRNPSGRPASLDPQTSPDGKRIVFTRGGSDHQTAVWIMSADGSNEKRLTGSVMSRFYHRASPKVDPTGELVVYTRLKSGSPILEILRMDSEVVYSLGPGESASWSEDGNSLVFVVGDKGAGSLWVSKVDGSGRQQLTDGTSDRDPAWSSDGKRIVFSRDVEDVSDLFALDLDTDTLDNLTESPEVSERNPAWSHDGANIAFTAKTDDSPLGWERSIFVMPASGGPARQMSSSQFNDTTPSWLRFEKQ